MTCGKGLSAMTRSMANMSLDEEDRWSKIFNGQNTVLGEVPWQAGLTTNPNATDIFMQCGGTLINPTWVVSAQHCFDTRAGGWRLDISRFYYL